ncbi:MAG: DUF6054 family protein [Candidatus Thorarchaeota archaeon]
MRSIKFSSEFDESILRYLRRNYSKNFSNGWNYGNGTLAVFVHEEYVWRTSSNQTIVVIFKPVRNLRSKITVICSGGRKGLLKFDWGSQSAAEKTLVKKIEEITSSRF